MSYRYGNKPRSKASRIGRFVGVFGGIAVVIGLILAACSISIDESAPDEAMMHYSAGPLTAEEYKSCVGPSNRMVENAFDNYYKYPAGQRTWDFSGKTDAEGNLISESGPITVTDSTPIDLKVPGILTFTLNTDLANDCAALREFHEKIGIKYSAYEDDGWQAMLEAYLANPVEKALDQASQKYPWRDLLQDTDLRDEWETEVGSLARQFARDQAGGDYFCDPNYTGEGECGSFELTLQKPILPPDIRTALQETEAEKELENQANAQKSRSEVEAETLANLVNVLGEENAVLFWAVREGIKEGQIDLVPLPFGSDIVVGSGAGTPASE